RVFREEFEGHGHFVQTNTFVGDPWSDPEENIGLPSDQEFLFIPYEITIESYPAFLCGVIFQDEIFKSTPVAESKEDISTDKKTEEEVQDQDTAATEEVAKVQEPEDKAAATDDEAKVQERAQQESITEEHKREATADTVVDDAETADVDNTVESEMEETAKPAAEAEQTTSPAEPIIDNTQQPAETEDLPNGLVSESIQRIILSPADLPGEHLAICAKICAEDVMQKQVIWADPEDTVQQVMTKMQQADAGYIMVGTGGTLEGLISDSDISGTISVYLKPIFSKWRRPTDDATLQIRVKWIMTKPVQTIKQDTSLTAIMNTMNQSGIHCLPVIDQQGKVSGLVTVLDILKALLNTDPNISTVGKTNQAPPLK
ncbi:MAG: CBS domain-containing protein, partial [Planctomycetes bacterium]|nr:CBS domain-containing protein [Planctomycetota bacterium]